MRKQQALYISIHSNTFLPRLSIMAYKSIHIVKSVPSVFLFRQSSSCFRPPWPRPDPPRSSIASLSQLRYKLTPILNDIRSNSKFMLHNLRASTGSLSQWHLKSIRAEPDAPVRYIVLVTGGLLILGLLLPWDAKQALFALVAIGNTFNPVSLLTAPFFHTCPIVYRLSLQHFSQEP